MEPEDEEELLDVCRQFIYTAQSLDIDPEIVEATRFAMTKSQTYADELIYYLERHEGCFLTFEDAWVIIDR